MSETREIRVPDIGDFKDIDVTEILVKPGDRVNAEQSLITVESDKASMEIPAPMSGIVREVTVKAGDKVSEGSLIVMLDPDPEALPGGPAVAAAVTPGPTNAEEPVSVAAADSNPPATAPIVPPPAPVPYEVPPVDPLFKPHASPSVRRFARELGVDLSKVKGSGPKGRILQPDISAFVKASLQANPNPPGVAPSRHGGMPFKLPEWPQVDFAKFGPIETKPLSRLRRLAGGNLHRNWISIPHVTQFDEADITDLEAFRKSSAADSEKQGFKLTLLAFLIKASVTALRQYPNFNASLDAAGENLVVKKYFHIGVAVDTPDGLVVPVIRDADRKGVFDLARELGEVSKAARDKKLKPGDMQGGTFSISSLGGIGGTAFTPIINAPEVAILGVSKSITRPIWTAGKAGEGAFQPRLMLPLSLSYDHRVIDGADAARFTSYLAAVLSDIRRSLL
jgi:pyruvate dehydrogenase E2 component (dihydrolipoamide acetyltransferase)